MNGLTQRRSVSVSATTRTSKQNEIGANSDSTIPVNEDESSLSDSTPQPSTSKNVKSIPISDVTSVRLNGNYSNGFQQNGQSNTEGKLSTNKLSSVPSRNIKTLEERAKIPNSLFIAYGILIGAHYFSGIYTWKTVESYWNSVLSSCQSILEMSAYVKNLVLYSFDKKSKSNPLHGKDDVISISEYARVAIIFCLLLSLAYVFFIAPFRAGFWTGKRSRRHVIHRYAGLFYLITYIFTWVEFCTNYEPFRASYLSHFVTCNGMIQGTSAFFSFKVLPELTDAGYYSDKAVLSRTFVHENIFFTFLAAMGTLYFIKDCRDGLKSNIGGRLIEHIFIFWPYIAVRPFFPVTSFSQAGTTHKGRTKQNERFYEIGTMMVKIFYLWAKYFFGFFINFCVYLDLVKVDDWKLLHGMLILNAGTVSLSVFLHTLRFKKVLPAKFTFSVYIVQIYLSFLALPTAFKMFAEHPNLSALCAMGLLMNFARSRKVHALWCLASVILLCYTDIKW